MGRHKRLLQIIIFIVILIIGAFTIITNLSSKGTEIPKIGSTAPDFTLLGLDGNKVQFNDVAKGKIIVLNFWGTFCPPCKAEMPALQAQYDKWKSQDIEIYGINQDSSRITAQRFLEQYNIHFPSLHDNDQVALKMYGVREFPTTFFIGADGIVKEINIGEMSEDYMEKTLSRLVSERQEGSK
ncbi:redoxin domain-containing protein [Paenibacillus albiflavus]|uniref:Redoxin domain-containing protein n=1 Tax=Paenibacillus albiflavus TaxID=2545760 RepID=A0A4R4ERG9_9BACL|nr:redoxin domain-containing protein [Paenibacillus albiflavus]TCZ81251.1 redoxin domain-containing protein [Paenibacillus albiflavus]